MKAPTEAGVFGAVNARNLKPFEVAQTFVPPPAFERLLRQSNAIVVGPRGSGKTTLLKMLQQEAMEAWDHPQAEALLADVRFVTAFVPTDYRWSRQLELLGEGRLSEEETERFAVGAYTTHALRAVCNTMLVRIHVRGSGCVRMHARAELSSDAESELALQLANAWSVPIDLPSLLALRQALSRRIHEIRWRAEARARGQDGADDLSFLDLPLIESLALGVEYCNDALSEPDRHWVMAMDELEFAPRPILRELLRALRGAEDSLLFKLALAPASDQFRELEATLAAAPEQDFEPVQLWYHDRTDGVPFCERLWERLAAARGHDGLGAREALGPSYFEPDPGPTGDDYGPDSKWARLFSSLAERDESFRAYLDQEKIRPEDLATIKGARRASKVRKVAPLLPLRAFYHAGDRQRSRKRATLYAGATSLFAISEGNPRWFIGLAGRILDHYEGREIDSGTQAREIEATAQRFQAYLQTLPAPTVPHRNGTRGVFDFIELIAEAIHDFHARAPFQPQPPSTFTVPRDVPEGMSEILKIALNAGALIYVPKEDAQLIVGDLDGKRFRVSYLLAPLYGLPLRLGRAVSLSSILADEDLPEQKSLPLDQELP